MNQEDIEFYDNLSEDDKLIFDLIDAFSNDFSQAILINKINEI